jgi:flagellar hook-associated protein 3 FlgL
MRITNRMTLNQSLLTIERRSERFERVSREATTGKRVERASDDPSASARILKLRTGLARTLQFQRNVDTARMRLGHAELSLQRATDQLDEIRAFAVQASTGTWSDEDRVLLAQEIDQQLESLLSEGNRRFLGHSLYAGSQVDQPVFEAVRDASGRITLVTATADAQEGRVMVQLSENESLQVNFRGVDVFMGGEPGSAGDVFDALIELRDGLLAGDEDASGVVLERIDAAIETINGARSALGTRVQRVQDVETQLFSREEVLTENLSDQEDADLADTMMRYTLEQTGYQAALSSISRRLGTSLLDFLR